MEANEILIKHFAVDYTNKHYETIFAKLLHDICNFTLLEQIEIIFSLHSHVAYTNYFYGTYRFLLDKIESSHSYKFAISKEGMKLYNSANQI